jgi:ubiquinone/menaquinone biosynthesis C-methylase UbiE
MCIEAARIIDVYHRRPSGDYAFSDLWSLQIAQRREFLLARMLRDEGFRTLAGRRVLDVGCGDGRQLRLFAQWGALPEQLFGCDVNGQRLENARRLQPGADFRQCDGHHLPYGTGDFDIVCQFTVFSSILSSDMRFALAAEMRRVVHQRGAIIWFDFRYNNPRNPDVRGIRKREIKTLFPHCSSKIISLGLLPPLARKMAALSPTAAAIFERLPPLRYAYLAVIRPEGQSQ